MIDKEIRNTDDADDSSYGLRDIFMMIVANWMWFVLAIALSLGFAAFHIYKTQKTYTRSAAILIKDSRRGNVTSALFSDITAARIMPNVENEIYLLGSQRLMTEVVKELDLDVWYTQKIGIRKQDLYGASPIEVGFPDNDNKRTLGFKSVLHGDNQLELSEFYINERDDIDQSFKVNCALGDTVSTPVGRIVINPTIYYRRYENKSVVDVRKTGMENTAMFFMENLTISLTNTMSSVIKLSVTDVNTRRAEALLNTIMKVYQADVIEDKRQVADVGRRFLDERLKVIESELASEDSKVLSFKETNRLVDFTGQTSLAISEGGRYRAEIFGIENQIALVNYLRDYLEGETKVGLIPANVGITDQYLNVLISGYNTEVLHRDELRKSSNDRNPTIMSMTSVLNAKFAGIMASISNLLQQLDINLDQARTKEKLMLGTMSSVPGQENEMMTLARQQTVKAELYLYLLNKKEESDLNSVAIDSDARIVEYAYGSSIPISPKPVRIIVFALLIAFVVPIVVLLIVSLLNTSVRSRKDLEDKLSVPFFGEIPYISQKNGGSNLIVKAQGRDPVSEAFRILRSNMSFMNVTGDMKVLLVTSTNVGSGKTFFSLNMAATLAMTGKRVVLVDGDMRKRTVTRLYGDMESENGLSRYLSDQSVTAVPMIVKDPVAAGVDMLFAGLQPPNPAELLMSNRLESLFEELRLHYDYILIDSVPAFMVADAVTFGRVADHTIYLIREGLMDRRQLPDIERLYTTGRFRNMKIVLNGIRESTRKYTYGYGYGYGYGSYGYGEEDKKSGKIRIKREKK